MENNYDARILPEEPFFDNFKIIKKRGESIKIIAEEGADAAVIIPNINNFSEEQRKYNYEEIIVTSQDPLELTVSPKALTAEYTFHVFVINKRRFADNPGYSAPKIIIKE